MMAPSAKPRPVVCHVTTAHAPFDDRIFHKECLTLARAGYDVHLLACGAPDGVVDGVRLHALPLPPNRLARTLLWPWLACRRVLSLRPAPALVHFHDPELLPAGQVLRLGGMRVIYDVHENVAGDLRWKPYLPGFLRPPAALAYRAAEAFLGVGMPTLHVLEEIARHYRQPRAVVRNLPWAGGAAVRPDPPAGRTPRLVYLGVISTDRGAMTMIELAESLLRRGVDFSLRLVGPILEAHLEPKLRRAIEAGGLTGRVSLAGPLPYRRVGEELAAADVGLCLLHPTPNYVNSLATKVLEYMRAGLPVVASDFRRWREHVAGTGAGVHTDVTCVEKIADCVQGLLSDPARMREMSRRGVQAVQSRYCWEREQQKLLAFYRRLLRE